MKTHQLNSLLLAFLIAVTFITTVDGLNMKRQKKEAKKAPRKTCNDIVAPRFDKAGNEIVYAGKTYEEWLNYYFIWLNSFPPTHSPFSDVTGQLANLGQPPGIFLVAGSFVESEINRKFNIPAGTPVVAPFFIDLVDYHTGVPGDPRSIAALTAQLALAGITPPSNSTQNELASLYAKTFCENLVFPSFTIKLDNCNVNPFGQGLIWTQPGHTFSVPTALGFPPNNFGAVGCGYLGILRPLSKGNHTLFYSGTQESNNSTFFTKGIARPFVSTAVVKDLVTVV